MAKKPDFAQKLLEDLRMRKERLATSQNSSHSNQMAAEKYRDFKRPYRESTEIGSSAAHTQKSLGNSNRSLVMGESSKKLVPVGRGRSSAQIADLSMALAFAFRNGGEFRKKYSGSTMAGYLNQFGGGSVDFREMDRGLVLDKSRTSSGRFPTLSQLHVKEISKGAQKLNQILMACYNGLNFDMCSTDIGNELLKGAIDLEESLKMLVDLQDVSEYMVTPQRKQKIRLVEVDDNDEEINVEVNKKKQFDRPRFSFDRPDKSAKQKHLAISYHTVTPQKSSGRQAPPTPKVVSHGRSASCGLDTSALTSLSIVKKQPSSLDSRPERGRIPNIIAKLMGLEELPTNKESNFVLQREREHVKQGARETNDFKRSLQEITKYGEQLRMDSENPAQRTATQKMKQYNKPSTAPETSLVLYVDKMRSSQSPFETEVGKGKVHSKNTINKEGAHLLSNSKKSTLKNKLDTNMAQLPPNTECLMEKPEKRRRQEIPTPSKQMNKGRGNEVVLKNDLQNLAPASQKHLETANAKQERIETKKGTLRIEKSNGNDRLLMMSNLQKSPHPSQQADMLKKSNSQDTKLRENERGQQKVKSQLQMKKMMKHDMKLKQSSINNHDSKSSQKKLPLTDYAIPSKKTSTKAFDAMPSKTSLQRGHHEDRIRKENSIDVIYDIKRAPNENRAEGRASTRNPETYVKNVLSPATQVLHVPLAQKVDEVHNGVNLQKLEVPIRENGFVFNMAKQPKKHISVGEEPKQSRHGRVRSSEDLEVSLNRSKEAETSIQLLNSAQELQTADDCHSILSIPMGEEYPRLTESETYSLDSTIQDSTTNVSKSLEASTISQNEDQVLMSSKIMHVPIKGIHEGGSHQHPKKPASPELLTENENYLKQILVNSKLFLNAAEALFGLCIPVAILHSSGHKYRDEDDKLALDCGYEVMKRKGRRQEFAFHPWANISVGILRIRCLDDLVRELHEDLETLQYCTEHEDDEYDAANTLHEMLQSDIQNAKPDVNCMWDVGWGDAMFAFLEKEEVIKDVEKHVLNGLLDEFIRDLLH